MEPHLNGLPLVFFICGGINRWFSGIKRCGFVSSVLKILDFIEETYQVINNIIRHKVVEEINQRENLY